MLDIQINTYHVAILLGTWFFYSSAQGFWKRHFSYAPEITADPIGAIFSGKKSVATLMSEAYQKFSKRAQAYRCFGLWVFPLSAFSEYRKLPSSTFSLSHAIDDTIYLKYFLGDDNTDVVDFVVKDVTRKTPNLIPGIVDEVNKLLQTDFVPPAGQDPNEWFDTVLQPAILAGIGRIASRFLAGKKYAADSRFTETASLYANGIGTHTVTLYLTPKFLHRFVARYLPTQIRVNKMTKLLRDDIYHYINHPMKDEKDANEGEVAEETILLRYLVKYVQSRPGYVGASREKVLQGTVGRLMGLFFAGIDTTTITTCHALFDLFSQPREDFVNPIKQQIDETFARNGSVWTQKALSELTLLDSFIKESQRLNPMALLFGTRKVMVKGGHTFAPPTNDPTAKPMHVPQGAVCIMPVYEVHHDPSVWSDPEKFQGFRYVRETGQAAVSTDRWLAFGHGRHVCPGRQLALITVKLIIIEMMNQYEWKNMEVRPANEISQSSLLPNKQATVTLRKKKIAV